MGKSSYIYAAALAVLAIPFIAPAQVKMGFIDSNRILQEFEEVRDAQAKLEKETRRLQAEYNVYVTRLDSLQREFEKQRLLLSNEMMRTKEAEMQGLLRTTQQFQQQKFGPEGDLYRYQAQLMAPILDKVDAAVKQIGAEKAYDYILDAAGGAIVYALPAHDLTLDVINHLRRGGK
ncbi:MAG: OmpH family outer membrane protein [Candidatus Marinimicrobia bacterium]|nr:OmpH family outer membrane protein [Candidatus Neomarinimicrobiota bacterium]